MEGRGIKKLLIFENPCHFCGAKLMSGWRPTNGHIVCNSCQKANKCGRRYCFGVLFGNESVPGLCGDCAVLHNCVTCGERFVAKITNGTCRGFQLQCTKCDVHTGSMLCQSCKKQRKKGSRFYPRGCDNICYDCGYYVLKRYNNPRYFMLVIPRNVCNFTVSNPAVYSVVKRAEVHGIIVSLEHVIRILMYCRDASGTVLSVHEDTAMLLGFVLEPELWTEYISTHKRLPAVNIAAEMSPSYVMYLVARLPNDVRNKILRYCDGY
jgi:hypothetical protein